jgi:hypothetical protein
VGEESRIFSKMGLRWSRGLCMSRRDMSQEKSDDGSVILPVRSSFTSTVRMSRKVLLLVSGVVTRGAHMGMAKGSIEEHWRARGADLEFRIKRVATIHRPGTIDGRGVAQRPGYVDMRAVVNSSRDQRRRIVQL